MAAPEGFDYAVRADGSVSISHRDRAVTTVRGGRAAAFLAVRRTGHATPDLDQLLAAPT